MEDADHTAQRVAGNHEANLTNALEGRPVPDWDWERRPLQLRLTLIFFEFKLKFPFPCNHLSSGERRCFYGSKGVRLTLLRDNKSLCTPAWILPKRSSLPGQQGFSWRAGWARQPNREKQEQMSLLTPQDVAR